MSNSRRSETDVQVPFADSLERIGFSDPFGAYLWACVAATFVLGDIVTTWVGLELGLAEGNPLTRAVINGWGFWPTILAGKGLIVSAFAGEEWLIRNVLGYDTLAYLPAACLFLMGSLITGWNVGIIAWAI